jgi:hypothetical protein
MVLIHHWSIVGITVFLRRRSCISNRKGGGTFEESGMKSVQTRGTI